MPRTESKTKRIRGYCVQCCSLCPTIATVEGGVFKGVEPDRSHPNSVRVLCDKAKAGPELVYSGERLKYPLKRTNPKWAENPGWKRISWDEALATAAQRLTAIKESNGAEAVAFHRSAPDGSQALEFNDWVSRLAHAYGSPNNLATTHICQWHRDSLSAYTFGCGIMKPEFDRSACILIWGQNPHSNWPAMAESIEAGVAQGAKLIVVDPRRTKLAEMADCWLQIHPGTDLSLALSFLNVIAMEDLFDTVFTRDWTTAPFLVRSDTKNLLQAHEMDPSGKDGCYLVWDKNSQGAVEYDPRSIRVRRSNVEPSLTGQYQVQTKEGTVVCQTVFQLLLDIVREHTPEKAETITRIPAETIRRAARLFAGTRPASYYTWNGIEQHLNASQTNRAICILYALTGNFDTVGSNRSVPRVPVNPVNGYEFLAPGAVSKRLGGLSRPLGPAGTVRPPGVRNAAVRANDFYRAVLEELPYPMKGLVSFGGNLLTGNPDSKCARRALEKLDFHVHAELFMTPAARYADIVLPAASFWETWSVRPGFKHPIQASQHVQYRPAVVQPQHEARADMDIIFELAGRMGLGSVFWDGDVEAGIDYWIEPTGFTVEELRKHPGGIDLHHHATEKGYSRPDPETGLPMGFNTPSKRIEIYSQLFQENGYPPLPAFSTLPPCHSDDEYPVTLTGFQLPEYSHGMGRCLPSLRRRVPHPFIEINPVTAKDFGVQDGDWVGIETRIGRMKAVARITETVSGGVVATQHGWWQGCKELALPGYDPLSPEGSNMNALYDDGYSDAISGSLPLKGYPCRITRCEVGSKG